MLLVKAKTRLKFDQTSLCAPSQLDLTTFTTNEILFLPCLQGPPSHTFQEELTFKLRAQLF